MPEMNPHEKIELLNKVYTAVVNEPDMFQEIMRTCVQATQADIDRHANRAMDFEMATASLLLAREGGSGAKGALLIAQDKIMKYENKTQNNWPFYAQRLPLVKE